MLTADLWRRYAEAYQRMWPCEALRLACWLEDDPWE